MAARAITGGGGCIGASTSTTASIPSGQTTSTIALGAICGDPIADRVITATDALFTLNAAVGLQECELGLCDVDDSGGVSSTDALMILQAAVGQTVALSCPHG